MRTLHTFPHTSRGVGTIEILVASSVLVVVVGAIASALQAFFTLSRHTGEVTSAALVLEEGSEAMLLLRDQGWETEIEPYDLGTEYHLVYTGGAYTLTATPTPISGRYYRVVTMGEARRDASDVIADSGTVDPDTRVATLEVRRVSDAEVLATGTMLIHNAYAE